jgi:hypothetical protein
MEYYTYAFLREDRTPYYIGKGKGNRAYRRRYKGEVKPPKDKSRILFLKQNLTEEEAFKHEKYMITLLGRKDLGTGILHNKTDGGEGASGVIPSDETKRKISKALKGKTPSEETRKKMSEFQKGKTISKEQKIKLSDLFSGNGNPNYGKSCSKETREKIGEANKNPSEETRRKMSEARKGKIPWNKGKTHSEESKRKMSETKKKNNSN